MSMFLLRLLAGPLQVWKDHNEIICYVSYVDLSSFKHSSPGGSTNCHNILFSEEYCSFCVIIFQHCWVFQFKHIYYSPNPNSWCCSPHILWMGNWLRDRVLKVFKYKNYLSNLREEVCAKERKQAQPCTWTIPSFANLIIWSFWCLLCPKQA